jgi:xylulokinase
VPLYVGFDASTQGLTALVIDAGRGRHAVIFEHALEFDRDLPDYGTTNGVWRHADPLVVTAPPVMWADALDRMMAVLARQREFDIGRIAALAGSGQQHGTVYLGDAAGELLGTLDCDSPLADQIAPVLTREESPVWMDESTRRQCAAITAALGGAQAVAALTGSRAFERFSGPQIRKFFEEQPAAYAATARIHLVSSFLASLLAGRHAPIDPGDGAGMNLMDVRALRWSAAALDATAPGLAAKLPPIAPSWSDVGPLAPYWRARYGFPAARTIAWSGDNPCSLVGTGIVSEDTLGVSLGTSDTVFGWTPEPRVSHGGGAHVFGSPAGGYMRLVCFRNGSLARERIRETFGLDWTAFSEALRGTPAGNRGGLLLPWFEPEITPRVERAGARRVDLDPADAPANVRGVVEAQMMAMANHWTTPGGRRLRRIRATGGASANREILQVMADVFGADVYPAAGGKAACLGAALRAYHAHMLAEGTRIAWSEVVAGFTDPSPETRIRPIAAHVDVYSALRRRYAECEAEEAAERG